MVGTNYFVKLKVWLSACHDYLQNEDGEVSFSYRLKENYILLSTDGPGRNVLKFKPPMCFSLDNAQHVVAKIDDILTGKPGTSIRPWLWSSTPLARASPACTREHVTSQTIFCLRKLKSMTFVIITYMHWKASMWNVGLDMVATTYDLSTWWVWWVEWGRSHSK